MAKKFVIEVVWHNCVTYPPQEPFNANLYGSTGGDIFKIQYIKGDGWYDVATGVKIPEKYLIRYWWADLRQTFENHPGFSEDPL